MRIFVLGGTVFVGRHFIEAALARGHEVTLFHRGKRGTELFNGVDRILGDRDGGLDSVTDKAYDAVVDTSGYLPRVVRQSVQHFAGRVPQYLFVSTISVYKDPTKKNQNEGAELIELEDPASEDVSAHYGALKALCEKEVLNVFPDAFIVRPGLIAGPFDPTNRFTYWVDRLDRGGEVLAPNRPEQPIQLIDARDLANFMILGLERGLSGIYNANGDETTFQEMIEACRSLRPDARIVWANEGFLKGQGISLWQELPLAMSKDEQGDGLMQMDSTKARRDGLELRPLAQTAADTLAWRRTLPDEEAPRHGLSVEKENDALNALKGRT